MLKTLRNTCFKVSYELDIEPQSKPHPTYYSIPHPRKTLAQTNFIRINTSHSSMIFDNSLNASIDSFHTETFSQHEVQDASKNTDTHHFCCHGRTPSQGYCNVADCDPLVPVYSFDHYSTTTSTIDLGAAIPEASNRLPTFSLLSFYNHNFLCRYHAAGNDYSCKWSINSNTISQVKTLYKNNSHGVYQFKKNRSAKKLRQLQICIFPL